MIHLGKNEESMKKLENDNNKIIITITKLYLPVNWKNKNACEFKLLRNHNIQIPINTSKSTLHATQNLTPQGPHWRFFSKQHTHTPGFKPQGCSDGRSGFNS